MNRDDFLAEFGSRTAAYIEAAELDDRPVAVVVGEEAHSPVGHLLATSLVNQLARAHRRLILVGDLDRELLCREPFRFTDLRAATVGLAEAINPYVEVEAIPATPSDGILMTIALGARAEEADLQVGCDGWCARFGEEVGIIDRPESRWGAALASGHAAAAAFQLMRGRRFELEGSFSLWDGGGAGEGQGPTSLGPLDLGRVLQVGAGAAGAALDYWLYVTGTSFPNWLLVDGDLVDVSNLNRQLLYLARHAGYPDGPAVPKARAAAELLGAESSPDWWGEDSDVVNGEYDLVLALANERGVRSALQLRQPPVLLHATTSPNWQAQSHRHIRGRDDCISCRLPTEAPVTECAVGEVSEEPGVDAALPFLSATAGLLLARDLVSLSIGQLADSEMNFSALDFGGDTPVAQPLRHSCREGCSTWLPSDVRQRLWADTRYAALDPAD